MGIRAAARLMRFAMVNAVLAPWVVLAALGALVHAVQLPFHIVCVLRRAFARATYCPRGHRVELIGVWECRCGALIAGHVLQNCLVCRERCGWISCPVCKLSIVFNT